MTDIWIVWLSPTSVQRRDLPEREYSIEPSGSDIPNMIYVPLADYIPTPTEFVAVEKMPDTLHEASPVYPELARSQLRKGMVWIRALVLKDGTVGAAMVEKDSGSNVGFERAALEAAMQFVYGPALQNGKPVAIWVTYPVDFQLE